MFFTRKEQQKAEGTEKRENKAGSRNSARPKNEKKAPTGKTKHVQVSTGGTRTLITYCDRGSLPDFGHSLLNGKFY